MLYDKYWFWFLAQETKVVGLALFICMCLNAYCVFLHSIALIWPSEWQMIQKLFVVDHVIKITKTELGDANPSEVQYISEPSKFSSTCVSIGRGKGCVSLALYASCESWDGGASSPGKNQNHTYIQVCDY